MTSKFSFSRINSPKIFYTHTRNSRRKPVPFTNRDEISWRGALYNLSKNFLTVWRDPIPRATWRNHRRRGKGTLPNYQSYFCWWRTDLHLNKPAVSHGIAEAPVHAGVRGRWSVCRHLETKSGINLTGYRLYCCFYYPVYYLLSPLPRFTPALRAC